MAQTASQLEQLIGGLGRRRQLVSVASGTVGPVIAGVNCPVAAVLCGAVRTGALCMEGYCQMYAHSGMGFCGRQKQGYDQDPRLIISEASGD